MEPKLKRLWSVYEDARADFLAVADQKDQSTINAAKFLRDTAENTIQYLKNRNADSLMLTELHATCEKAKDMVVGLTGGKKRKFDRAGMDSVKGVPRGPSNFQDQSYQEERARPERRYSDVRDQDERARSERRYSEVGSEDWNRRERTSVQGRGRGHSGIPYGYTRPVDSYHPS